MVAPAAIVMLLLFAGGMWFAVAQSIGGYGAVLRNEEFRRSLLLTFRVAGSSALLSGVFGLLLALAVAESRASDLLLRIPIATPHLAVAIVIIQLISPGGIIARLLHAVGLISQPSDFPALINDAAGIGIIATYILKETPFVALVCLATLRTIPAELRDIARVLGANRWQRLTQVTIPLLLAPLSGAVAIVFAFVFSAFEIPWLLGRPWPAMLGVVAQNRFMTGELAERPEALALAVLTSTIALGVAGAGFAALRTSRS